MAINRDQLVDILGRGEQPAYAVVPNGVANYEGSEYSWQDALSVVVELDKREWKYFLDTRADRYEWQVMRFSWFGDYNDASTFLDIFSSNNVQNLPRYESVDYDQLIQSASLAPNQESRTVLLAKAEDLLINDYPIAPLYFFVSMHMVKPTVMGFENNVLDRHPSRYLYRRE